MLLARIEFLSPVPRDVTKATFTPAAEGVAVASCPPLWRSSSRRRASRLPHPFGFSPMFLVPSYTTTRPSRNVPGGRGGGHRCALGCEGKEAGPSPRGMALIPRGFFARLPLCPLPEGEDVLSVSSPEGDRRICQMGISQRRTSQNAVYEKFVTATACAAQDTDTRTTGKPGRRDG